jgi:glycosyltransferase involved in cell wall biosynthesis
LLAKESIPHQFTFYGPSDGAFSHSLIKKLDDTEFCTYRGPLPRHEILKLCLNQNKLFVSSSLVESFGHFILEPMAFQRICFVPKTSEAIELGSPMAYYYDHNDPNSLYKLLSSYYHDLLTNHNQPLSIKQSFDLWKNNYISKSHSQSLLEFLLHCA